VDGRPDHVHRRLGALRRPPARRLRADGLDPEHERDLHRGAAAENLLGLARRSADRPLGPAADARLCQPRPDGRPAAAARGRIRRPDLDRVRRRLRPRLARAGRRAGRGRPAPAPRRRGGPRRGERPQLAQQQSRPADRAGARRRRRGGRRDRGRSAPGRGLLPGRGRVDRPDLGGRTRGACLLHRRRSGRGGDGLLARMAGRPALDPPHSDGGRARRGRRAHRSRGGGADHDLRPVRDRDARRRRDRLRAHPLRPGCWRPRRRRPHRALRRRLAGRQAARPGRDRDRPDRRRHLRPPALRRWHRACHRPARRRGPAGRGVRSGLRDAAPDGGRGRLPRSTARRVRDDARAFAPRRHDRRRRARRRDRVVAAPARAIGGVRSRRRPRPPGATRPDHDHG